MDHYIFLFVIILTAWPGTAGVSTTNNPIISTTDGGTTTGDVPTTTVASITECYNTTCYYDQCLDDILDNNTSTCIAENCFVEVYENTTYISVTVGCQDPCLSGILNFGDSSTVLSCCQTSLCNTVQPSSALTLRVDVSMISVMAALASMVIGISFSHGLF